MAASEDAESAAIRVISREPGEMLETLVVCDAIHRTSGPTLREYTSSPHKQCWVFALLFASVREHEFVFAFVRVRSPRISGQSSVREQGLFANCSCSRSFVFVLF